MINRYRKYLQILDEKLDKMFKKQAPFIKCQKGCAYCCKEGEYPMSELEFIEILFKYNELEQQIKDKVDANISNLLKSSRQKLYECPFLVDNVCSVYQARGLICRTFGLLSYNDKTGKKKMPFCVDLGLNYSNVYDKDTKTLTECAPDGTEPLAFNIDRTTLRSPNIERDFNIFFGEDKALVDWLREEFQAVVD
ncbi:YkgJ family cysteine cluster protein [bacterium]|nr:YkgJ family cysteine cluster protein [bacterium]